MKQVAAFRRLWTVRRMFASGILGVLVATGPAPGQGTFQRRTAANGVSSQGYLLGTGDQLRIWALGVEEMSRNAYRIDEQGQVDLPMVGVLPARGRSVEDFRAQLAERLRKYVNDPELTVTLAEYGSQPVSVLGAVNSPGIHQLKGPKTVVEVLSLAGGMRPDAGNSVKITRASSSGSGEDVLALSVKDVLESTGGAGQILVQPGDVIAVSRAQLVYVIGTVRKAGGFVLNERETISVLQALSMAEGLERTAAAGSARILRLEPGNTQRREIPVDLGKVLAGRAEDVQMKPEDILFVPNSFAKSAGLRAMEAAIQITTGIVIWRR